MRFSFRNRNVEIELQALLIAILVLGWALFYYFSIMSQPEGKESVLFIKPLTVSLVVCFFFIVFGTIKIDRRNEDRAKPIEKTTPGDIGFFDHRRIFFAGSMIAYAAALTFFGFMLPSVIFLFIVFYYLGVRNRWVLIIIPIGLTALLCAIFVLLMKVPLKLWPSW